MTPKDFWSRYKNLSASVTGPDGAPATVGGVTLTRYVINSSVEPNMVPDKDDPTKKVQQGFVPKAGSDVDLITHELQKVREAFAVHLQKAAKNDPSIKNATEAIALNAVLKGVAYLRVQIGKGTPDDMENILKAGLICGKLTANPTTERNKIAAADFAQQQFGIDCTGFVNAYFFTEGKMSAKDVVSNWWDLSCPWLYNYARNHGNQIFWTPQDIAANKGNTIVVWMLQTKGGGAKETRKPGHISLVHEVTINGEGATLDCYESNGASPAIDPRNTTRIVTKVVDDAEGKYWLTDGGEKLLLLRPFT